MYEFFPHISMAEAFRRRHLAAKSFEKNYQNVSNDVNGSHMNHICIQVDLTSERDFRGKPGGLLAFIYIVSTRKMILDHTIVSLLRISGLVFCKC